MEDLQASMKDLQARAMEDLNVLKANRWRNLLAKYELVKEIGSGGQGKVYRVRNRGSDGLYACKTIAADEDGQDEVEFMNRVRGCPGVVFLHEVIHDSDYCHMILELCDSTMNDRIEQVGALSEREAAIFFKQLAASVGEMHKRGLLHRDLNCENVFITAEAPPYQIRVGDLGCGAVCPRGETISSGMTGTDRYLPPEAALLGAYSEASDVWALGLILYECLSGCSPYARQPMLEANIDITASLAWCTISQAAKDFILAMLQVDPKQRPTIQQIVEHPWIAQHDIEQSTDDSDDMPLVSRALSSTSYTGSVCLTSASTLQLLLGSCFVSNKTMGDFFSDVGKGSPSHYGWLALMGLAGYIAAFSLLWLVNSKGFCGGIAATTSWFSNSFGLWN